MRFDRPFDVDFTPRSGLRTRPSLAALVLFAVGIAAVATTALLLQPRLRTLSLLRDAVTSAESARAETQRGGTPVRAERERPADAALLTETRRIAADLHRPWLPLLDAVEAASTSRVRLTQMTIDARFNGAQLQVEARGVGDVVRYAQALSSAGAPIGSAQLANHEWIGTTVRVVSARVAVTLDPRVRGVQAAEHAASAASATPAQVATWEP